MYYGKVFTDDMIRFLQDNAAGIRIKDLTTMVNDQFGLSLGYNQVRAAMKNRKIKTGYDSRFKSDQASWNKGKRHTMGRNITSYQPGSIPHNRKPLGAEKIADGYIWVKVKEPRTWKQKSRIIWAEAHGPLPKGSCLIYGDGNRLNCTLDNLILIDRKQLARLNQNHLIQDDIELTRTGIVIADIINKIGDRKRGMK